MTEDNIVEIVEEIAQWASTSPEAQKVTEEMKPIARHFQEKSKQESVEVLIAIAKGLIAGYYIGKYGFPAPIG